MHALMSNTENYMDVYVYMCFLPLLISQIIHMRFSFNNINNP